MNDALMRSGGASVQTVGPNEATRLRLERDLYLGLLGLNETTTLDPVLRAALDLIGAFGLGRDQT